MRKEKKKLKWPPDTKEAYDNELKEVLKTLPKNYGVLLEGRFPKSLLYTVKRGNKRDVSILIALRKLCPNACIG